MHHPDFYITPVAATTFLSGKVMTCCPWLVSNNDGTAAFKKCTVHPADPNCSIALGAQLRKRFGADWKQRWLTEDSHAVFEGRLPSHIPLAYVPTVIMTQARWDSFIPKEKDLFHLSFER